MSKELEFRDLMDNMRDTLAENLDGEDVARIYNSICSTPIVYSNDSIWHEVEVDDRGNCEYCGGLCWEGDMCDEQQAGGFNEKISDGSDVYK